MSEVENWSTAGVNILAPPLLDRIRAILEQQPIIVEHGLYRGSSAPLRLIFDEFQDFFEYLKSRAKPGDRLVIWDLETSVGMTTGSRTENIPMTSVARRAAALIKGETLN